MTKKSRLTKRVYLSLTDKMHEVLTSRVPGDSERAKGIGLQTLIRASLCFVEKIMGNEKYRPLFNRILEDIKAKKDYDRYFGDPNNDE